MAILLNVLLPKDDKADKLKALPGQRFQLRKCFGRVGVGQFIPIRNVNGVNMRGIFPKQNTSAHALR